MSTRDMWKMLHSSLCAHPAITGPSIIVKDAGKVICWSC